MIVENHARSRMARRTRARHSDLALICMGWRRTRRRSIGSGTRTSLCARGGSTSTTKMDPRLPTVPRHRHRWRRGRTMAEVILPCTYGPTNDIATALSGLPHWCEARRDQPLRGVHGCRSHCVYRPIGSHRRERIRSVHRARPRRCSKRSRSDGLPFLPVRCGAIMSPRRPTLATSLPAIAACSVRRYVTFPKILRSIARVNGCLWCQDAFAQTFGFTPGSMRRGRRTPSRAANP